MELNILSYVNENMLVLIPILYILGMLLKRLSVIKDNLIPLILLVIAMGLVGLETKDLYQSLIQGTLVTGVCVLGSQLIIQSKKGE